MAGIAPFSSLTALGMSEDEGIRDQLAYAEALRKNGLDTQGQMVSGIYVPKNPWQNFIESAVGSGMNTYQRGKQNDLQKARQAQRDQFLSQMPSRTTTQRYDPENAPGTGPLIDGMEVDKPIRQYADEMQRYGMQALNIPGMEGVGTQAIQYAMQAPEREAAQNERLEARKFEVLQRAQAEKERKEQANEYKALMLGIRQQQVDIARDAQRDRSDRARDAANAKRDELANKDDAANTLAEMQITNIDQMIGKRDPKTGQLLEGEKVHPGFDSYVGFTYLPGLRYLEGSNTANYQALNNQVTSQARLEGVQAMKGTGSVSNAEGQAAAQAITRLSKAQSEEEYIKAALEYRAIMEKAVDRRKRGVKVDQNGKEYSAQGNTSNAYPIREVQLKDGRIGVEWSNGSRTIKNGSQ